MSSGLEQTPGYTPADVVKAVLVTAAMAAALSLVYGPVDYYSPLVYLNVLLAALTGMGVGRCAKAMLRRFRIDSEKAATLVGVAGALVAVWCSWLTYLYVAGDYDFAWTSAFVNPANLWDVMGYIAENPVWTITSRSGRSMSGSPALMYWFAWLVEAGMFIYFSVKECRAFVTANKLCPQCRQWLSATGDVARFAAPTDAIALSNFSRGDLTVLKSLPRLPADAGSDAWLEAVCNACAQCGGLNAHVTVTLFTIKPDKKKKPETVKTVIANMVEITPELEAELFHPAKAEETAEAN